MPIGNGVRSPVEIVQDVLRDVRDIVRGEVQLARTEVKGELQKAGKAGGYFAAAGICGFFAGACLVACIIAALATTMPVWLAALFMCVILACIAGAVYAGGRSRMKTVHPVPERTVETMKDNLEWAKRRTT
jgi:hypothetical protein